MPAAYRPCPWYVAGTGIVSFRGWQPVALSAGSVTDRLFRVTVLPPTVGIFDFMALGVAVGHIKIHLISKQHG